MARQSLVSVELNAADTSPPSQFKSCIICVHVQAAPNAAMDPTSATEILNLSASSPLPIPVGRAQDKAGADGDVDKENGLSGFSPRLAGTSPSREPIAPYQALPVTSATITENYTPALPVIDQEHMTPEVSWRRPSIFEIDRLLTFTSPPRNSRAASTV